jgi:hypothetical protein
MPTVQMQPIDLRPSPSAKLSAGERMAHARDRIAAYAMEASSNLTEKEKEELRREMRERYGSAARSGGGAPTSFRGLQGLANQRIEDAIARGQFKDLPRGTKRDARADNPFIDTTEYILNNMIKRQDMTPPWIEKQQQVVAEARTFRMRLRQDWKRHAVRILASRGGSLQSQVRAAELYARAEKRANPKTRDTEKIAIPSHVTDHPVMVRITQDAASADAKEIHATIKDPVPETGAPAEVEINITATDGAAAAGEPQAEDADNAPLPAPFRDPQWEAHELSYLTLAVDNLNKLTRSYNLMAPSLAKKPYFSLERELRNCYADVAPELGQALIDRATKPKVVASASMIGGGGQGAGVLGNFGMEKARVYDERRPQYGFKEFLGDLFRRKGKTETHTM